MRFASYVFSYAAALLTRSAVAAATDAAPPLPKPTDVLALMEHVADWQLAHNAVERPRDGWVQSAGYAGIMAVADISGSPRFHDAMLRMAQDNRWKPGPRPFHADDQCVSQTYLDLYFRHRDPAMLAPTITHFDYILAHPLDDNLAFVGPRKNDRWAWCDALFMAPPAWLRLWVATGKPAYLDFMLENWWKCSAYLYDRDEHLYYRDSTYFEKREANGRKVFWSRGNGWVIGGLVRVLQLLPAGHPARPRFEQQFREMAAKIVTLQSADGFWHSSLLDPASYPAKEASGTGFFTYGLLWGVNQGLLDRPTYLPAALRAWNALISCVQPDGKVIHVQPIGADPRKFDENSTEPYGVGAVLLAGSELYRMAVLASTRAVTVTVRNPTPLLRPAERVEIDVAALRPLGNGKLAVLEGAAARVVPSEKLDLNQDGVAEKLSFQADFPPGDARDFKIVPVSALAALPTISTPIPPQVHPEHSGAPLIVTVK